MMVSYIFFWQSAVVQNIESSTNFNLLFFSCRISFVEVELNLHGLEEKENKHFLVIRYKYYVFSFRNEMVWSMMVNYIYFWQSAVVQNIESSTNFNLLFFHIAFHL
jgi:hypothetical protein